MTPTLLCACGREAVRHLRALMTGEALCGECYLDDNREHGCCGFDEKHPEDYEGRWPYAVEK